MSSRTARIVAFAFVLVVALPLVLFFFGVRPSEDLENRTPTPAPVLVDGWMFDTETYAQAGDYIEDRLPLRDQAIKIDAAVDLTLFSDSPNPDVIVGPSGWLFLADRGPILCANIEGASALVRRMQLVADALLESGREIRFLVAPAKVTIYADEAPDDAESDCATESVNLLQTEAAEFEQYVDIWSELNTLASQADIYYSTDTHWNGTGAAVGSRRIVDSLNGVVWRDELLVPTPRDLETDLSRMIGLPQIDTTPMMTSEVGNVVFADKGDFDTRTFTSSYAEALSGRTLVIFDSFGIAMEPSLIPYLAESTWVHWNFLEKEDAPEVLLQLMANTDTVIIESLDTVVFARLAIWERIGVIDALTEQLASLPSTS